jgi:hypothetical protein
MREKEYREYFDIDSLGKWKYRCENYFKADGLYGSGF